MILRAPVTALSLSLVLPLGLAGAGDPPPSGGTDPFTEEDVSYESPAGNVKLGGTLLLPRAAGPHAAVLLLSGTGPQDRDERMGPLTPFRDIAHDLGRRGIAVLRVDDRGVGKSTGNWTEASFEDSATDALRGVELLKGRKEIDPKRIGLLGHSEGGAAALLAAARSPDVAFIVLLAAACVPNIEIILKQNELVLKKSSPEAREKELEGVRKLAALLRDRTDPKAAEARFREAWRSRTPAPSEKEVEDSVRMYLSPWSLSYWNYDPTPLLEKLRTPVLALWGGKDVLVRPEMNVEGFLKCRKAAGEKEPAGRILPGINHFGQESEDGDLGAGIKSGKPTGRAVLDAIGEWILARCR